jgi:hypothetical protein
MLNWIRSLFSWSTPAQRRHQRQQQLEVMRLSLVRGQQLARVRAANRARWQEGEAARRASRLDDGQILERRSVAKRPSTSPVARMTGD